MRPLKSEPMIRKTTIALALLFLLPACAEAQEKELTILFTNDSHAGFEPTQTKDGKTTGGILAIDAAVRAVRAEGGPVLLLDGGDVLSGHPITNLDHEGVDGGALFQMMNLVGYDAVAVGNHDLDNGQEALAGLAKMARFAFLCANLVREDGSPVFPQIVPSRIFERGGLKVGVFGIVLENVARSTAARNTAGLSVLPQVETARRLVAELDPKTDLIVALCHEDEDEIRRLVQAVPGIDLVIAGHEHTTIDPARRIGSTLVCRAGVSFRQLGRIDLVVEDDAIRSHEQTILRPAHEPEKAGAELRALVGSVKERLDVVLDVPIGKLDKGWHRNYYGESNMGDWVAGALAGSAGADVGFLNSGSLRKDLSPGTITVGDVLEIFAFQNYVCTFEVTGKQLVEICRHNAWSALVEDHGILQVSGVSYAWREAGPGKAEVQDVRVGGKPVDLDATYVCASTDFVVYDNPEKYLGLVPEKRENLSLFTQDVLIEAVKADSPIANSTDERIRRVP